MNTFSCSFHRLPPSVNNWLIPRGVFVGGRVKIHMQESDEFKEFKLFLKEHLRREIKLAQWDKEVTEDGHWYLDVEMTLKRKDSDPSNYIKALLDACKDELFIDDNNILERIQRVQYSTEETGFSFVLRPVNYVGVFQSENEKNTFLKGFCENCSKYRKGSCSILKKKISGYTIKGDIGNECIQFKRKVGKKK